MQIILGLGLGLGPLVSRDSVVLTMSWYCSSGHVLGLVLNIWLLLRTLLVLLGTGKL